MKHTKTYIFALAVSIALSVPLQSYAQKNSFDAKSPAWWNQLGQQLAVSLNQPVDQVRDETLQHIVYFATNHSDKVTLNHLAPDLLDMYKNERNEARRTMAVVALRAIGNRPSMNRLARLARMNHREASEISHWQFWLIINEAVDRHSLTVLDETKLYETVKR